MDSSVNWYDEYKFNAFREQINAIRENGDTTQRIEMLNALNASLPPSMRIQFPSLITNAYIRTALDKIEDRLLPLTLPV